MPHEHHDHKGLISGISEQMKHLLDNSDHAIYIYLDDRHKVCNKKYATLLGFKSPQEWAKINDPLNETVAEKSKKNLVAAYTKAMQKGAGSTVKITWKKKSGANVNTNVILVPIMYNGHAMALHFVSK